MKTDGCWQRKIMFESLKTARRKPCCTRRSLRGMFLCPGFVRFERKETRNHRAHFLPNGRLCPNEPGAAGPKHPFVCACRERVASQRSDFRVFHSQPVYAIDDQENTILFFASAIRFGNAFGDARDGQANTATGVHPRHANSPRLWSDCLANPL